MPEKQTLSNSSLNFINCPTCLGRGVLNNKFCPECLGISVLGLTGRQVLYWGKKINQQQITQDKFLQFVRILINLSLLLFGALGLILLGWQILILLEKEIFLLNILQEKNIFLLIFWLTLGTDCYLFYRFNRDLEKNKNLPKKIYYEDKLPTQPLISWSEIKKIPKEKQIDVSQYFITEATESVVKAWQLTHKYQDATTTPIHLFISLLGYPPIQMIFSRLGVPFANLKNHISHSLARQIPNEGSPVVLNRQILEITYQAYFLAYQLKQKKVDLTELLEVLAMQENEVKELLSDLNIDTNKIINVTAWLRVRRQLVENWRRFRQKAILRPKNTMNRAMTAVATPILNVFSQDLTLYAKAGYFAPCIGRQQEINEIFNIMASGTRRLALLIGQPGVGKNTIIEGIAQKMVEEDVPKFLQDRRLVTLEVAKLVSGVNPSQAQERLLMILSEIKRSGNIILFIDNIHNLTGMAAGRQGSIDLADVLAQTLSHNTILTLATSTPTDYHHYLENKSSLDNVFEKIEIREVSGNEAIQILEAKAGTFEGQNQIFFSYDAIAKTVELSNRYFHERYLPEKALEILQQAAVRIRQEKGKNSLITGNDVALIISEKTHIPLADITQEESEKLLNLEAKIHQRLINQKEAVEMVASSLRRARAEMRDQTRPIVNLLFLGPTGVGKTELAKTVAEVYFGHEKNMIRLDMSEYQDKPSLNRLIGAPLGYANTDDGFLTESVRKNPFSLVLLDEIEKAHPDILNIFLQIMDDGRLTDNSGRTIDFTNTIIIATSNAGTGFIQEKVKQNIEISEIKKQLIENQLPQYFRPEFLNRFDGIIVFKPLGLEEVKQITKLMLDKVGKNLEEKGISLQVEPNAINELAQAGFDPQFGARPLRRVIQQKVQDKLANLILSGEATRRDQVVLAGADKINIMKAKKI